MSTRHASPVRANGQSSVGRVQQVEFQLGREKTPICEIENMVGLPDSSWPGSPPKTGQSLAVRIVSVHKNGRRSYCFVLPASQGEAPDGNSKAAASSQRPATKKPAASEEDFFFSLPEIPSDAVKVRFKYRGKRLLGNYEGRPLDPDWRGWGCERQPKVAETWLVRMQIRPGYEVAHAIAVQGPLKKKK